MRKVLCNVVVCCALLLVPAVSAEAAKNFKSQVTLGYVACGTTGCDPPYSTGTVTSSKTSCVKHRQVVVRQVGGGEIGRDVTDANGVYRVDNVPPPNKEAVAVATRKALSHGVCVKAVSEPATFIPPP